MPRPIPGRERTASPRGRSALRFARRLPRVSETSRHRRPTTHLIVLACHADHTCNARAVTTPLSNRASLHWRRHPLPSERSIRPATTRVGAHCNSPSGPDPLIRNELTAGAVDPFPPFGADNGPCPLQLRQRRGHQRDGAEATLLFDQHRPFPSSLPGNGARPPVAWKKSRREWLRRAERPREYTRSSGGEVTRWRRRPSPSPHSTVILFHHLVLSQQGFLIWFTILASLLASGNLRRFEMQSSSPALYSCVYRCSLPPR